MVVEHDHQPGDRGRRATGRAARRGRARPGTGRPARRRAPAAGVRGRGAIRRAGTGPSNSRASTMCGNRSKPVPVGGGPRGEAAASSRSSGACSAASCRTIARATASTSRGRRSPPRARRRPGRSSPGAPSTTECPGPTASASASMIGSYGVTGFSSGGTVSRNQGRSPTPTRTPQEVGVGAPSLPQPPGIADELDQRVGSGFRLFARSRASRARSRMPARNVSR